MSEDQEYFLGKVCYFRNIFYLTGLHAHQCSLLFMQPGWPASIISSVTSPSRLGGFKLVSYVIISSAHFIQLVCIYQAEWVGTGQGCSVDPRRVQGGRHRGGVLSIRWAPVLSQPYGAQVLFVRISSKLWLLSKWGFLKSRNESQKIFFVWYPRFPVWLFPKPRSRKAIILRSSSWQPMWMPFCGQSGTQLKIVLLILLTLF